jgi:hypothetical protein
MKTRERIKAMRKALGFSEKISLAQDDYPRTAFDGLFADLTGAWVTISEDEPGSEKAIRNQAQRSLAIECHNLRRSQDWQTSRREDAARNLKCLRKESVGYLANIMLLGQVGVSMADAIAKGESGFLREMADALDLWTKHVPQPDKLRSAVILTLNPHPLGKTVTMRHILSVLPKLDCPFPNDEYARKIMERRVRTLAKELGLSGAIKGKPGAPKRRL